MRDKLQKDPLVAMGLIFSLLISSKIIGCDSEVRRSDLNYLKKELKEDYSKANDRIDVLRVNVYNIRLSARYQTLINQIISQMNEDIKMREFIINYDRNYQYLNGINQSRGTEFILPNKATSVEQIIDD